MLNFHTAQKNSLLPQLFFVVIFKRKKMFNVLRLYIFVINSHSLHHMAHFAYVSYCHLFN